MSFSRRRGEREAFSYEKKGRVLISEGKEKRGNNFRRGGERKKGDNRRALPPTEREKQPILLMRTAEGEKGEGKPSFQMKKVLGQMEGERAIS